MGVEGKKKETEKTEKERERGVKLNNGRVSKKVREGESRK